MSHESPQYQVRALERALDLLDAFSLSQPELSFTELTERIGLAKGTTVRLLAVLERRGLLERSSETDRYRLGVRAFELGSIYIQSLRLETESDAPLRQLTATCSQTANLGILDRGEVVHLLVVPANRPIQFSVPSGQRDAAHSSGLGKVLLAALSDDELDALIAERGLAVRTPKTIVTADALKKELARVRELGYAIDDEESVPGLTCIAAPVLSDRGHVVGAVSVSGQSQEFTEPNRTQYIDAVQKAARGISQRLGAAVHMGASGDSSFGQQSA